MNYLSYKTVSVNKENANKKLKDKSSAVWQARLP